jgi:hypothetical protein
MPKEKGLFKDNDRFMKEHERICSWFLNEEKARLFVLYDVHESPSGRVKVVLEQPVRSASGFLYGFADVLLHFHNDQGQEHTILIEAKSAISDLGSVLRQIRTYQEYLSGITRTYLIHSIADEKEADRVADFFGSQDVCVLPFRWLEHDPDDEQLELINGRRDAACCGVYFRPERDHLSIDFLVYYPSAQPGQVLTGLVSSENLFHNRKLFAKLALLLSMPVDPENPVSVRTGELDIPCQLDLTSRSSREGGTRTFISAIQFQERRLEIEIGID